MIFNNKALATSGDAPLDTTEKTHIAQIEVTRDASGLYNDDRDIGAGSSGVLEGENRDRSDRPPRKRSPGGIDAAAGEHVRANFSLHRRAGYREESEATDVVATMIFRGGKRDIRASVPISMEMTRRWPTYHEPKDTGVRGIGPLRNCVRVCMSLPPLSVCFLLEINYGTRNRIFEMLIFLVELSMGKLTRREGSGFLFFFLKFSTLSRIILKWKIS